MGQCYGKNVAIGGGATAKRKHRIVGGCGRGGGGGGGARVTTRPPPHGPAPPRRLRKPAPRGLGKPPPEGSASPLPAGLSPSPARSTPRRLFRRPFPPPSPAKHIRATLAKRLGAVKPAEGPIPEDAGRRRRALRAHVRRSGEERETKGQIVAVKIIPKAKMTTAISIEDVRREVKILKALSGHKHLVKFYDACEDDLNVYIVMELCEGGELLDRILARGGRYNEEDAKATVIQILSVVAFCHLQGVVHRDLKPENFLFTSKDENATMKLIDFGLSDFIKPDERLNDIVGSAYYVAPEVLHRSYSMEADIWSIGVITYILLCGSRPFWARTESGVFRSVLRADPNYDDSPWPSVSAEAKDFVKRLLNKDYRKRMTAAQALAHPWLREEQRQIPLDMLVYKLIKQYLVATPLKRAALRALSKALSEDELLYLRSQFELLEPNKNGLISLENFRMALVRNYTQAMKASRVLDILNALEPLTYRRLDFEEFCAAAISPYQLEALERWEEMANTAFEHFEQEGNRVISVEELTQELNLAPSAHSIVEEWIRKTDGKLNFLGFTKFIHGVTMRYSNARKN
uniref:Protein kinase domain-containing protein n=1 Tax=Ananas comosus var. bracteatus TaxID=296719 RepID=A0A6V7NSR4_ANACO|nr:unnamed protein product [Ananas comosus var. bracteatus]